MRNWLSLNRLLFTLSAILIVLGAALVVCAAIIESGWGADQLGPASAWVAAFATFLAVFIALSHGSRSHKVANRAIEAAEDRAVVDREFEHRRQITNQFADLFADVHAMKYDLAFYVQSHNSTSGERRLRELFTAMVNRLNLDLS